MITGCSNHGCAVKGETSGMHANGICQCVKIHWGGSLALPEITIRVAGRDVGRACRTPIEAEVLCRWLREDGLRDILALEGEGEGEE